MRKIISLLAILLPLVSISQITITLQPDGQQGKDAKVYSLDPNQNFGSDLDIIAATWTFSGSQGKLRSMFQFDLSSIPAGAQILDAKLSLFYNFVTGSAGQAGENASYLRRILDEWDENTVNWNTQPGFTNTNQVYLPKSTSQDQDYENINVTHLIKDMVSDPSHSFGFMFSEDVEDVLSSMKFFSSDASQASQRPKLEITYSTEPTQCLTLQPGNEGKDAKVFSLSSNQNFGNDLDFIGAAWSFSGSEGFLRSYIDFDLSGISQNAQVVSAALSLYYNTETSSAGQQGSNTALLQRVIDPWNEQTITWNTQPGTTNSNQVILPVSSSMSQDYIDIDVTTLIGDILSHPGESNGIMIRQENEDNLRSMKFSSGDVSDASKHPKLEICYQINTATKDIKLNEALVYPNPFTSSFTLQNLPGKYNIIITDINGKIIHNEMKEANDGNITIENLDYLPSGFYMVNALNSKGNYQCKIVKSTQY